VDAIQELRGEKEIGLILAGRNLAPLAITPHPNAADVQLCTM
jgi:hypothetical protein